MNKEKKYFRAALCLLTVFVLWTAAVSYVDVQEIGPQGTSVGLAGLNAFFHRLTGVHLRLYFLTDWLSIVPFCFVAGFALLGLQQWSKRKKLCLVDRDIFALGGFYAVVLAAYLIFEQLAVNFRPILIDGQLEVSYPSSTTVLVLCVMTTAVMQWDIRIQMRRWKGCVRAAMTAFAAFMVIGRVLSGVHWLSDIIGGLLLSGALVMMYCAFSRGEL